jgi:tetratricopeptide (TPR) repeat protein
MDDPHRVGLFGVLATRYRLMRRRFSEVEIWSELAPFIAMQESEGIRALAEYIVYQEWPAQADLAFLRDALERALTTKELHAEAAAVGTQNGVAWAYLINPETKHRISLGPLQKDVRPPEQGPRRHLKRAAELFSSGRPEEAVRALDAALSVDPGFEDAWFVKGNILNSLGQSEEAISCYERAPSKFEAWCNMGLVLRRLGRSEAALRAYDSALALNPEDKIAWLNRGVVQWLMGRPDAALQSYERALFIDEAYSDAWVNKGIVLHDTGKTTEAIECLNHGLTLNADDAVGWTAKGNVLLDQHLWKEAVSCYDRALEINRHLEQAWLKRGGAQQRLGHTQEAMKSLDHVLAMNPRNAEAWLAKGFLLMDSKVFEQSLSCFNRSKQLGSPYAEGGIRLCEHYIEEQNLDGL